MKKTLLAISAIALGASLLGFAAPAHADDAQSEPSVTSASAEYRTATRMASIFHSPRDGETIAMMNRGDKVLALCGLTNSSASWVKIIKENGNEKDRTSTLGFVRAENLEGGITGLPDVCPSELTTLTIGTHSLATHGTIIGRFDCPADYPYLADNGRMYGLVAGLTVTTSGTVNVPVGLPNAVRGPEPDNKFYQGGYSGGIISGYPGATVGIAATCTSDIKLAKSF